MDGRTYYKLSDGKLIGVVNRTGRKYSKAQFLPPFWFDTKKLLKKKYDISIIGTDHDNRYNIVEKILPQVKDAGLTYYFKILIYKPDFSHIAFYKTRLKYCPNLQEIVRKSEENYHNKLSSEIAITQPISPEKYNHIIDQTACVLDTDRETQHGTTPRAIWALAKGKKIISTNRNFLNAPFYNPEQIKIIDRDNPILDIDFIKNDKQFDMHPYFEKLRIENWVKEIVGI